MGHGLTLTIYFSSLVQQFDVDLFHVLRPAINGTQCSELFWADKLKEATVGWGR